MSVLDFCNRRIPEHYRWMYLDGYTPDEVLAALRKKMQREYEDRQRVDSIKITSEVKVR